MRAMVEESDVDGRCGVSCIGRAGAIARGIALAATIVAFTSTAGLAQDDPPAAAPDQWDGAAPASAAQPRPEPVDVGTVVVRAEVVAPDQGGVPNPNRVLVDSQVSDVRVNEFLTVAIMNSAAQSNCGSNEYIFERDRPGWVFQTGRLLQAMKEGAVIRVSFRCVEGYQSINAIQFLTPPNARVATAMPLRAQPSQLSQPRRPAGAAPLPFTNAANGANREQRVRQVPLP